MSSGREHGSTSDHRRPAAARRPWCHRCDHRRRGCQGGHAHTRRPSPPGGSRPIRRGGGRRRDRRGDGHSGRWRGRRGGDRQVTIAQLESAVLTEVEPRWRRPATARTGNGGLRRGLDLLGQPPTTLPAKGHTGWVGGATGFTPSVRHGRGRPRRGLGPGPAVVTTAVVTTAVVTTAVVATAVVTTAVVATAVVTTAARAGLIGLGNGHQLFAAVLAESRDLWVEPPTVTASGHHFPSLPSPSYGTGVGYHLGPTAGSSVGPMAGSSVGKTHTI